MVTTTHRGWWPALEPALLAFAAVVCSGVSLLALSHVFASECHHHCDTTRSSYRTAAAADQDPLDDDDDDAPDAAVAAPIVLTSGDGFGRLLVERESDAASTLRGDELEPRGPPQSVRVSHHAAADLSYALLAAASPDPLHWTSTVHDSIDDGDDDGDNDDDDGADDAGDAIAAQTTLRTHDDSHHPVVRGGLDVVVMLRAENIAPRGPPLGWHRSARLACAVAVNPADSPDVDVTDDDDDDDEDDHGKALERVAVAGTRGSGCILSAAHADHLRSFASHDHSLRAPPQ